MFSLTTEYALRATVWLAEKQGLPQTTQQIASATCVPLNYLSKVLQSLGKAGLVRALRGKHGGFELAKSPSSTSVLEIINVVEPIQRIRTCPLGLKQHSQSLCPLHKRLDHAMEIFEESFASATLADLLTPYSQPSLCGSISTKGI
jgi:Rrf2 family transcriptional regulator, nitric oxide-sensitive transcriptional repressor